MADENTQGNEQVVTHVHHHDPEPPTVKVDFARNSKGWTFEVTLNGAPDTTQMDASLQSALYMKEEMIKLFPQGE